MQDPKAGQLVENVRGRLGDKVYRVYRGKQIVSDFVPPTNPNSADQQIYRDRFKRAHFYLSMLREEEPDLHRAILRNSYFAGKRPTEQWVKAWMALAAQPIPPRGTAVLYSSAFLESAYPSSWPGLLFTFPLYTTLTVVDLGNAYLALQVFAETLSDARGYLFNIYPDHERDPAIAGHSNGPFFSISCRGDKGLGRAVSFVWYWREGFDESIGLNQVLMVGLG